MNTVITITSKSLDKFLKFAEKNSDLLVHTVEYNETPQRVMLLDISKSLDLASKLSFVLGDRIINDILDNNITSIILMEIVKVKK